MNKIKKLNLLGVFLILALSILFTFNVNAASLSKKSTTITQWLSTTLTLKGTSSKDKIKWTSSDSRIVKVSGNGKTAKIIGKKKGSAVITAAVNKKKYTCKVTVQRQIKLAVASNTTSGDGVTGAFRRLGASVNCVNAKVDPSKYDGLILPGGGRYQPFLVP